MADTVLITGNTYPVRQELARLGGVWDATAKGWRVPASKAEEARKLVGGAVAQTSHRPHKCKVCGYVPTGKFGDKIYRSGECRDCYEERKMGY